MARGITEQDVHVAADELVMARERPTVERIRAHLGTGSPNTVTRHLETWWQGLGGRLNQRAAELAFPEAPDAVSTLAGQWWKLACDHARAQAEDSLNSGRAALAEERDQFTRDRQVMLAHAREIETRIESALTSEQTAVARSAELQRLVAHLEVQIRDLVDQRDAAAAREAEANQARHALAERLRQSERDAQAERASLSAHIQATENRAGLETNRARQEVRELRTRLTTLTKSQAEMERTLRETAEAANAAAVEARQQLLAERARADALDQQLSKLRDLPAALKAVMQRTSRKSVTGSQAKVGTRRRRD